MKEAWIRSKYEKKEFLTPLPSSSLPLTAQLAEAMFKKDLQLIVFLLAHCTTAQINAAVGPKDLRTPLHLAAAIGSSILTQLLLWVSGLPYSGVPMGSDSSILSVQRRRVSGRSRWKNGAMVREEFRFAGMYRYSNPKRLHHRFHLFDGSHIDGHA